MHISATKSTVVESTMSLSESKELFETALKSAVESGTITLADGMTADNLRVVSLSGRSGLRLDNQWAEVAQVAQAEETEEN